MRTRILLHQRIPSAREAGAPELSSPHLSLRLFFVVLVASSRSGVIGDSFWAENGLIAEGEGREGREKGRKWFPRASRELEERDREPEEQLTEQSSQREGRSCGVE